MHPLFYSLPPLMTLSCFLGFMLLIILRRRRSRISVLLFVFCFLGACMHLGIIMIFNARSPETALFFSRFDHRIVMFTMPVYIHFFHAFLGIQNRRWVLWAAYGFALGMACMAGTPLLIEKVQRHVFGYYGSGGRLYPLVAVGAAVTLGYTLLQIYRSLLRGKSNVQREKLKYILTGFGLMGLLNGLNVLPLLGWDLYPPGCFSFAPLIFFGIGVLKYDVLDMGSIVNTSILYSVLTTFLIGVYALIVTIANRLFSQLRFSDSFAFPIIFSLLVAVVFSPMKTAVRHMLDRRLNRHKAAFNDALERIGRKTAATLKIGHIVALIIRTAQTEMQVRRCLIFLKSRSRPMFLCCESRGRTDGGRIRTSPVVPGPLLRHAVRNKRPLVKSRLLEESRCKARAPILQEMNALGVEVMLPLVFHKRLVGVIALGERRAGGLYLKNDLRRLDAMALQVSLSIVNAGSYRLLRRLNQQLDRRVAARTRELSTALAEKEKTREQLVRSESLAAIGQLVAGVAHELNNPLSVAISLLQSTLEELPGEGVGSGRENEPAADLLLAERELKRARDVVSSLLGLSRQTQTYAEHVNLNTVIRDALRVLESQFKHEPIRVDAAYAPDLPPVKGNFANLGQVALNIIKNAMQAVCDQGGTVQVSTGCDKSKNEVFMRCEDSGPGIAAAHQKDIFKPFFTTKPVGEGTGLGLYICHEIIQRHGGRIVFSSRPGRGARFDVVLPLT